MPRSRPGPDNSPGDVTRLLQRASAGDDGAAHELYEQIYGELHRLARLQMNGNDAAQMLQPTALVNEAWLRIAKAARTASEGPGTGNAYRDRDHFLSVASRAMRSALVDHARRRDALKRGGGHSRLPLTVVLQSHEGGGVDILALDDALQRLATDEPRQSRVVELAFFGGLTHPEVARTLDISLATVERDWRMARMWLREELRA